MVKKAKQKQVRAILVEAVRLLCTRELDTLYRKDFIIQGLLGITLDSEDIILIDINEIVTGEKHEEEQSTNQEKDKPVNVKDVSGILKNTSDILSTDKDDTHDSKLRRLLNTSTSDEEAEHTKLCDLENSNGEHIDKSVLLDTSEDRNDDVIMESDDFDIKKPFIVTRTKSSMKLSQSLLKRGGRRKILSSQKPQICYLCGITTKNMYGLKNHLATVHNEGARYKCDVCSKGFLQRQSYEDHINAHKGKKTHCCPICGKSTPFATSMRRHMRHHRMNPDAKEIPRPYQCNQCESKFKTELGLKEHVNIEHLDRRIRCGCGQEFKWRSAFARHKAKCLLVQYSVTDPNPQRKISRVNRKSSLSQPSKPIGSRKDSTNASLGKTETSSANTTIVTMESQPQFSKPPTTPNLTTPPAANAQFNQNPDTSVETAAMIRKYTDLLCKTKDKNASTTTTKNQQIQSSTFGVNQHQANPSSLTRSNDTGGSVNFVTSGTPGSVIGFQLVPGTNTQTVTRQSHHQGYVPAPLPLSQISPILHQSTTTVSQGTTSLVVTSMSRIENQTIRQQFTSDQKPVHFTSAEGQVSNTQMIDTDAEQE